MRPFQELLKSELAEWLLPFSPTEKRGEAIPEAKRLKQAKLRAQLIFRWVYQRMILEWDEMTDIAKPIREAMKAEFFVYRLTERISRTALDGTHKFLWDLIDGKTIESVIIPAALQEEVTEVADPTEEVEEGLRFSGQKVNAPVASGKWGRLTACISSQVGCAMACKFCLTGVQGLDRSLKTHEIVAQIHELRRLAPITNIVFMGMGEPLHNFEAVTRACQIFLDSDGLKFSKRKVTISTSGLVPAIRKLGEIVDVSLAISLNGSTNEGRSSIMPVNKKWDIQELLQACKEYPLGAYRRITFEYVLLKNLNDSDEDALRVFHLLKGIPSKVNLIPFNAHSGATYERPTDERVKSFQKILLDRGMTATVRISRGRDILAACGQLRSIFGTARGTEKHKDFVATAGA